MVISSYWSRSLGRTLIKVIPSKPCSNGHWLPSIHVGFLIRFIKPSLAFCLACIFNAVLHLNTWDLPSSGWLPKTYLSSCRTFMFISLALKAEITEYFSEYTLNLETALYLKRKKYVWMMGIVSLLMCFPLSTPSPIVVFLSLHYVLLGHQLKKHWRWSEFRPDFFCVFFQLDRWKMRTSVHFYSCSQWW